VPSHIGDLAKNGGREPHFLAVANATGLGEDPTRVATRAELIECIRERVQAEAGVPPRA
jgi:hypothetical protein